MAEGAWRRDTVRMGMSLRPLRRPRTFRLDAESAMRRDIEPRQSRPYATVLPRCPRVGRDETTDARRARNDDAGQESSMDRVLRELLECEYLRGD